MAPQIHKPTMDGSRLDFESLSLGCRPGIRHTLSKSAMLKGEKCRNERKTTAVMESVRNKIAGLKGRAIAGPHDYEQIPALVERSVLRVKNFFADFNERLGEVPFVAGERYSAADITALVTVDFAKALELYVPADHAALKGWYESVSSRPSAAA